MIAQYTQSNWSMANDCNDWTLDSRTFLILPLLALVKNGGIQKTAVFGVTYIL